MINKEEWEIQQKAIRAAVEAFEEVFEADGWDPSYWSLRIEVRKLTQEFDAVVETLIWDGMQRDVGKL